MINKITLVSLCKYKNILTHLGLSVAEHTIVDIRTKADFELLFNTWYSKLCSYANGFLKDLDASEEIVQEVMLKIWINRARLEITSSIQSYLFRAVRNGCLNLLKHVNIREEYKSFKEREDSTLQRSHEEEMMVSELESKIREAIDRLPMERRRVFIMSRYDGMTYNEIAENLGISVKTVENQMSKALKFLREELAEYLPFLLLLFNIMEN
ncbi:MAG: RNA polymerase sigma-70 factor [Bacteroidia bacterium]|nr:RNA polymerase sigma-70 factor [Bacteroidia bacterium]